MEYADNGDLYQKIQELQRKGGSFQEEEVWSDVHSNHEGPQSLALNESTTPRFEGIWRVSKTANVFLTKTGSVKIGDMNVSKISRGMCETQTGTPYYASPEVWKDQPYDRKSDMAFVGLRLVRDGGIEATIPLGGYGGTV